MEKSFRDRFVFDNPDSVYLDGNSLGRLPKATRELLKNLVEDQWGERLIAGWNEDWLDLPHRIGNKIGQIIGAGPGETIVCDSTSVNLFKLGSALLEESPTRNRIVSDEANFPSDLHILSGITGTHPDTRLLTIDVDANSPEGFLDRLSNVVDERTSFVTFSHVHFKTGELLDMKAVTRLVHSRGARVLWDLSHSVGALPIDLTESMADAAVGCTYKYLNGGPGAPAFLSIRKDLVSKLNNPIQGWFGTSKPFEFSNLYEAHDGIDRFTVGTPPILSMAAIEPGIDLILEAGINNLRKRSIELGNRLIDGFDRRLAALGYSLLTPANPDLRGSHISLGHHHGWQITQDLIQNRSVVPDFREPNIIRLGITPLYTTDDEVDSAIDALEGSVEEGTYQAFPAERTGVT